MKKFLSKVILAIVIAIHSPSLMSMETQPNFDEVIDKLVFETKAQTQYLENWFSVIKEETTESDELLKYFIFPVGDEKLRKQRAILDLYIDFLYSQFIEKSLICLKEAFHDSTKDEKQFNNKIIKFRNNLKRSYDLTVGDIVKRGGDYLTSVCINFKVIEDEDHMIYFAYDDEPLAVKGAKALGLLAKNSMQSIGSPEYSVQYKEVFENNPPSIHYYNQAFWFKRVFNDLSLFQRTENSFPDYCFPDAGKLNLVYDNIYACLSNYNAVIRTNVNDQSLSNITQINNKNLFGFKLSEAEKRNLKRLQKIHQSTDYCIHYIPNENDFITKQIETIFSSKSNNDWGSNSIMDQHKKNAQQLKKNRLKNQNKTKSNKVKTTEIKRPSIERPLFNINIVKNNVNSGRFFLNPSPPYAIESYSLIVQYLDLRSLCSLICTTKSLHPLFLTSRDDIKISANDYKEESFDFHEWYKKNVIPYSHKNQMVAKSCSINVPDRFTPQFCGLGGTFLNVVFGGGYVEVTTKHFDSFLKQAGGYKVKMGQNGYLPVCLKNQSVETHYIVPSLLDSRDKIPFFLCFVHLPHAGSIPFPKKTLYNFIRRDLEKAGYSRSLL